MSKGVSAAEYLNRRQPWQSTQVHNKRLSDSEIKPPALMRAGQRTGNTEIKFHVRSALLQEYYN